MEILVAEMVFCALRDMGADGLYNGVGECVCPIDDMSPADCLCETCQAASLVPMEDDEIEVFGAPDDALWYVPFRGKAVS